MTSNTMTSKKKPSRAIVWAEAKVLLLQYRRNLIIGFALMIVSRLLGFVLPTSTKFLIDNVLGKGQWNLLGLLALAVGMATLIQAITSFAVSQVVSVAAQEAIMEMRKRVQEKITLCPFVFLIIPKAVCLFRAS